MTGSKPADRGEKNTKASRGKRTMRWVIFLVVVLILGLLLYQWTAGASAKKGLPMPFGYGMAVVMSGSMEPALHVNDFVVAAKKDDYNVGDIVVFQSDQSLTVHRIVARDGDLITTQGDVNNTPDDPVPISAIQGVVVLRIPFLGAVVRLIKKPIVGTMLLLGAFFSLGHAFYPEKKSGNANKENANKGNDSIANPEEIRAEIQRLKAQLASEDKDSDKDKV